MNTLPANSLRISRAVTCALAATLACALYAQNATPAGQNAGTSTSSSSGPLKHADKRFLEKAVDDGRDEVEIARGVLERSTNADVKKFAQMMVDDHSRVNEQLEAIAGARGVTLKKEKDKDENKWAKKDAKDIDRDYAKKMVSDHKKAIDLFSKESKDGADTELVELARKTLPALQHHLEEANYLEKTVR